MSALVFRRRRQSEQARGYQTCTTPDCVRVGSGGSTTRSMADVQVFIMGRPAGWACNRCRRELQAAWDSALDTPAVEPVAA